MAKHFETYELPIYPAPSADELKSVGHWQDHSGFAVLDEFADDAVRFNWVADGTSPLSVYRRLGEPASVGVVSVMRGRYGKFPAQVAAAFAKTLLLLGESGGCGAVYFYDSSIVPESSVIFPDKRIKSLFEDKAQPVASSELMMRMLPGGKVLWQGDVPDGAAEFMDRRYRAALASDTLVRIEEAFNEVASPHVEGNPSELANDRLALFERLTFGLDEVYKLRFPVDCLEPASGKLACILSSIAFSRYTPPDMGWCNEARDKTRDIIKIWRVFLMNAGKDWRELADPTLPEIGRELGVDYAMEAYLSGIRVEYVLAGLEGADGDIPF